MIQRSNFLMILLILILLSLILDIRFKLPQVKQSVVEAQTCVPMKGCRICANTCGNQWPMEGGNLTNHDSDWSGYRGLDVGCGGVLHNFTYADGTIPVLCCGQ